MRDITKCEAMILDDITRYDHAIHRQLNDLGLSLKENRIAFDLIRYFKTVMFLKYHSEDSDASKNYNELRYHTEEDFMAHVLPIYPIDEDIGIITKVLHIFEDTEFELGFSKSRLITVSRGYLDFVITINRILNPFFDHRSSDFSKERMRRERMKKETMKKVNK